MNATTEPSRQWTPEQLQAIHARGTSLLVAAAAGSGKTSVLAERCVELLCNTDDPCDIGDLLVVTFTESAALEMKSRISSSLNKCHLASPSDITGRHLAMLDRARIGTLHGFCSMLLRQNFHLLGIDPEFKILDGDEARMLKVDVANAMFSDRYDDEDDHHFRKTIDLYADGNDLRLVMQVIRAYDTLCSVVDPPAWVRNAKARIEEAIDFPMDKSELGQAYLKLVDGELTSLLRSCQAAGNAVKLLRKFPTYVEELREMYRTVLEWKKAFKSCGLEGLTEVAGIVEFDRLAAVSNSIEGKSVAKDWVDSIRRQMKEGTWRKNLQFTTDEWKEGLRLTLPHVDVLLSLVSDFSQRYSLEKDEASVLDFSDLEMLTLRALKEPGSAEGVPTPLARSFHHQYKHVLVDEYQDINAVQDAILSLVSRECLGGKGALPANLFCVGDVKQSIYRFRLAEPKQFLDRRELYTKPDALGQVIDLQQNFRSRAPLLAAINGVFERLMTRDAADIDYDQSQKLIAGATFAEIADGFRGSPIELHLLAKEAMPAPDAETAEVDLEQPEREAVLLGKRILELTGHADRPAKRVIDRGGGDRPIRFSDIVLLLRSMQYKADQFAGVLRGMGVPVHTESATGYFQATEINDVLSLLHVLDNQRQDIPLAAVLRSPIAAMENAEANLTRVRLAYRGEPPVPFHLAVQKYAEDKSNPLAIFLQDFLANLRRWRQEVRQKPLAEALWSIYDETGYLAYVTGLPNGEQRQANLIELHDRARQFGTFERQGLSRFLAFLEKLKKETDLGQASVASEAEDVVRIMSIHKSKGREFPVVLLPDLGKAINLSDCQGSILLDRSAGLGVQVIDERRQIRYPSLSSTVVQQRLRQQALAEELRVLYVAMTRAKEHLILVGSCAAEKPETWQGTWAGHTGPLPAEAVLAGRSPLDWLGPVATLLPQQIAVQMHTVDELGEWAGKHVRPPAMSPTQLAMANAQPIDPAPVVTGDAQAVIDRMEVRYRHEAVADLAAAASVTSLVKKAPATEFTATLPSAAIDRVLPHPEFLAGKLPLDAADKGTATHAVLEHFDFARGMDSLDQQIAHLTDTRRLSPQIVELIDTDAIRWFLQSDIGLLIQGNARRLKRELPVYYANPSDAAELADPLDQQMVRGRIDLLLPADGGWILVDYKTDSVSGPALDERVKLYAGQLEVYRRAIQKITGQPVVESVLVFLTPREIRRV